MLGAVLTEGFLCVGVTRPGLHSVRCCSSTVAGAIIKARANKFIVTLGKWLGCWRRILDFQASFMHSH